MTTDIEKIKYELIDFYEVKFPYKFKKNQIIKYITLKNNSEKFYTGGKFIRMGNECIVLSNGGKDWSFKTKIRNNNNDILYNTRIFIKKNLETSINNDNELKNIIDSQQKVIDKMSNKLKQQEKELIKYKNMIQKLKSIN
jgi:hypothetical protein